MRQDIVFERIFLPISLQYAYMNSRGKNPRSAARMSEDAISCLILTIAYELYGSDIVLPQGYSLADYR